MQNPNQKLLRTWVRILAFFNNPPETANRLAQIVSKHKRRYALPVLLFYKQAKAPIPERYVKDRAVIPRVAVMMMDAPIRVFDMHLNIAIVSYAIYFDACISEIGTGVGIQLAG